jgi:hypothetical protein
VGPPVEVQVKGLSEPLTLYELLGLDGRLAPAGPVAAREADHLVAVDLPLECWVIEGKVVRPDAAVGRVVRLGRREVLARLDPPPAPLTNVKLRLQYPAPIDRSSEAIYAKVLGPDADGLVRMRLTAVDAADAQALTSLVGQGGVFTPS